MSERPQPEAIPLSFLNAIEYCPRRFYYEFVQGEMLENEFVLEGTLLHQRADEPGLHREEGEVQINRLYLHSETLRLAGFADIIEEQQDGSLAPVEYKHGKEGKWLNDHVQLCAQALCLEERQPDKPPISFGYIFYFGSRKRVQVHFTPELRAKTRAVIDLALQISLLPTPPPPLEGKMAVRCRDCSLYPICLPTEVILLKSKKKENPLAYTLPD